MGLGSNQGLFSPLDPIEAQVSVCLLRTKDSTAIGVKSWILFVSLRFVAGGSVGWSFFFTVWKFSSTRRLETGLPEV